MTMLGRSIGLPAACRALRQRHFMARPARWIASEEPTVAVPTLSWCSEAPKSRASMLTQRSWISTVWGYSSQSMAFLLAVSTSSRSACSSIQVVTKVARLRIGLPSRASSSWIT